MATEVGRQPTPDRIRASHTNRFTILTVCTANICRSPLSELLLRRELDTSVYEVGSAGIHGFTDRPMDEHAATQAVRFGAEPGYFKSRAITADMIDVSGLILTATRDHRSSVLSLVPTALRRSFTLLEFAQLVTDQPADSIDDLIANACRLRSRATGVLDIEDPYRRGELVHQQVAERIVAAVRQISVALDQVAAHDGVSAS